MLKEIFTELLTRYTADEKLPAALWNEISAAHSAPSRHYHNLQHLEQMAAVLAEARPMLQQPDLLEFSLCYHDIVYNPERTDNEVRSAGVAEMHLRQLGLPAPFIDACRTQILATQAHVLSPDADTNYFTDADLCILGQSPETYQAYARNVRKEYGLYPDAVYIPGRKKVLIHFLEMDRIFKTAFFYERFETQARHNLQAEWNTLNMTAGHE